MVTNVLTAQAKANEFIDLNIKKVKLEDELKELNKTISSVSIQLFEAMEDEELDSLEPKGIKLSPDVKQSFSLAGEMEGKKWDDEKFFKWLKSQRLGGIIKTKKSVQWNTRDKVLKEYIEKGKKLPEWIKEGFFNTIKYNSKAIERLARGEN